MKLLGLLTIIAVGYLFGATKRKTMLLREEYTARFLLLFGEMKYVFKYKSSSLVDSLFDSAQNDDNKRLAFMEAAEQSVRDNKSLNASLVEAFRQSTEKKYLNANEIKEIEEAFRVFGTQSEEKELEKLEYVILKLKETLEAKRAENKSKKGYFETIYSLAGVALSIMLI